MSDGGAPWPRSAGWFRGALVRLEAEVEGGKGGVGGAENGNKLGWRRLQYAVVDVYPVPPGQSCFMGNERVMVCKAHGGGHEEAEAKVCIDVSLHQATCDAEACPSAVFLCGVNTCAPVRPKGSKRGCQFRGKGEEEFECLVPLHAAESVLDVKADKCGGGAVGDGSTDFGDLVLGARWASCAKLVWSGCNFDLCFGGGGDNSEGKLD